MKTLTAIPRITLGLVSLSLALLLAFDLLLHLFPSDTETTRELRTRTANMLALQTVALLQTRDMRLIERTLAAVQARDADIVSIGLRRSDGTLVARAGEHYRLWKPPAADGRSTDAVSVGLMAEQVRWGDLEVQFKAVLQRPWKELLLRGPTLLLGLFSLCGGVLFFVYLRRMLQHLDPSGAVPERVRGAFDALTEGVLIVDPQEHVLLANQAFTTMGPEAERATLLGRKASSLAWMAPREAEGAIHDAKPWLTVMRTGTPLCDQPFEIGEPGGTRALVLINCSPLHDERRGVRGCLITVDDVTVLARTNEQLLEALGDLVASKRLLEMKNGELEDLANIDPLSGCLNRRAFNAGLAQLFAQPPQGGHALVCILADIDHFKRINDGYGHAVGDEAIQAIARILRSCVRHGDLVGRYGGEEFCIVISGMPLPRALEIAEVMRTRVAAERGIGQAGGHTVSMTASFGVSTLAFGARNEAQLVDQADQAMFQAKLAGRDRVVIYEPKAAELEFVAPASAPTPTFAENST